MKYLKISSKSPFKLAFFITISLQVVLVSVFFLLRSANPALDIKLSENQLALNTLENIDETIKEPLIEKEENIEVGKTLEELNSVIGEEVYKDASQIQVLENDKNFIVVEGKTEKKENSLNKYSKFSQPIESSSEIFNNVEISEDVVTEVLPVSKITEIVKPKVITHKLEAGDTLASIWGKYANDSRGGFHAANAFKEQGISLNSLKVGDEVELQLSDEQDITALKKSLDEIKSILLTGDSKEGYKARILEANIVEKEEQKTMFIDSSIAMSAYNNGISYGVIDDIVDIFSHKLDFRRDIHPGDSFTIVYTKREYEDGKSLSPGPVKAASIKSNGKILMAVRHVSDSGNTYYYDQDGKPIGSYFLRYPLKFSRISSVFNRNRFHPVLKRHRPHNGVDFAAPTGTPVRSIGPGVVQIAGWKGGGGRTVKIKHNSTYSTAYLHLSKISKGIRVGARVEKGQIIGAVGMSGLATGPHLHFSLYDKGKYVDPLKAKLPVIQTDKDTIPSEYLKKQIKLLNFSHEKLSIAANADDTNAKNYGMKGLS